MMKRFCLIILLTILSFIFLTSVSGAEPVAAKKKAVEVKTPVAPKIRESEVAALLAKGAERQSAGEREVAVHYYRQAAAAGNSEGAYRAGTLAWERPHRLKVALGCSNWTPDSAVFFKQQPIAMPPRASNFRKPIGMASASALISRAPTLG
jgi:hypothetical protein